MDNKIYINNYYCRNSVRISTIMEIRQYCQNAGRISKNFEILPEVRHCRNSYGEILIVEILQNHHFILFIGLTSIDNNGGDKIDANEGVVVNNEDVINTNISISLLIIKGTCSDDTSFLFQISFNFN